MKNYLFLIPFAMLSCQSKPTPGQIDAWKAEVWQAEVDFAAMAKAEGMPEAFLHFAAEDAALNRNSTVIKGKAAIKAYFDEQTLSDVNLVWAPDFVSVSASGDMAYTYGKYTFTAKDLEENTISSDGIFHTVWKRQADGSWKYVWD